MLRDTPQLVILTFDDSVNDLNKQLYQDIFHTSRLNILILNIVLVSGFTGV